VVLIQQTFDDVKQSAQIHNLTERQRRLLGLLAEQVPKSRCAELLKVSTACISQHVKRFLSWNLIQRVATHPSKEGKRNYTHFYSLSPEAKGLLIKKEAPAQFSSCRVHHAGIKYKILRQSGAVSVDKRTAHNKTWTMRGGKRHGYFFAGKDGMPSVSVYVHPGTLIAWVDKGQQIPAGSSEAASRIADIAIHEAVEKFKKCQGKFGVIVETDKGQPYKKHYGFAVHDTHPDIQKPINRIDWWVDKSNSEIGKPMAEVETDIQEKATALERTIDLSQNLPDLIAQTINPLGQQINRVEALLAGGRPLEVQYARALDLIERLMERLEAQDRRIATLEGMMKG